MAILKNKRVFILGGGVTGLAAGITSGFKIFEAAPSPGGLCSTYYKKGYRFELGGGHWIFGCDPLLQNFFSRFCTFQKYERKASVFFADSGLRVPYPLQANVSMLGRKTAAAFDLETKRPAKKCATLKAWLKQSFGPTLCRDFFYPFHERYTDGLYGKISPQDEYKSPGRVKKGAGYNPHYFYPEEGLGGLCRNMAAECEIEYGKKAVRISPRSKKVFFQDGSSVSYDALISTLPLNVTMQLAGLNAGEKPDPFTSVLVVNIGAVRGPRCPKDHWVYVPKTKSGFYRVGFYSNVDTSFLPWDARAKKDRAGLYVERSFANGAKPSETEIQQYCAKTVAELQSWGWISRAEIVDPTWVQVGYTWSRPGSSWKSKALKMLEEKNIYPLGRYGRWHFQGIAESVRDGLWAGSAFHG